MHTYMHMYMYTHISGVLNMHSVLQPVEKLAKGLVSVILALSLVAARADFMWLGNSELLNYSAGRKQRKQTIWLRRILLLEVSFCTSITSAQYSLSHHTFTWHLVVQTLQFWCLSATPFSS